MPAGKKTDKPLELPKSLDGDDLPHIPFEVGANIV
jgi:hypothetical protein